MKTAIAARLEIGKLEIIARKKEGKKSEESVAGLALLFSVDC